MWRVFNACISFMRIAIGIVCLACGDVVAWLYGSFEIVSGSLGLVNCVVGKYGDFTWRGIGVTVLYFAGLVFVPSGEGHAMPWLAVEVAGVVLRFWGLWHLREGYTAGMPSWVRLVEDGPYAYVRHPMAIAGLMMRWAVVFAYLSWFNVASAVCYSLAVYLSVLLEEAYLTEGEVWRGYASRVRYRLIPGVY